jgi:hypothetical protein
MVPLAPRYDPRILASIRALDDRREPVARRITGAVLAGRVPTVYEVLDRLEDAGC